MKSTMISKGQSLHRSSVISNQNSSAFEMSDDKQELVTKENPLLHWESELGTKTEYTFNVTSDDESNTKSHI